MFSSVSSGRFYFGGLFAPHASPLPFSARKHASFLPGALEGAACLKPGDAAPRSAPPLPAESRAALPTQVGDPRLLAAAACGPCLPRAPGIAATGRFLALLARLVSF